MKAHTGYILIITIDPNVGLTSVAVLG